MPKIIKIDGTKIKLGEEKSLYLKIARQYDLTELEMPVKVMRGKKDGPVLFLSAAIHGDELNGIEIVRRVISHKKLRKLVGTVIAVPIVNVFGLNHRSRYLPDRRDLNRSFPGSAKGSLASRMAKRFISEIVSKCTHGIDFHTGSQHRSNLPQIRADIANAKTLKFAKTFKTPIILNSAERDGSLREAARKKKVVSLLFEGGEALRFEENVIKTGVNGCLAAMASIGMLGSSSKKNSPSFSGVVSKKSYWVRAKTSGTILLKIKLGQKIHADEVIGLIKNPLGEVIHKLKVIEEGIVIAINKLPLVNQGDAVIHVAIVKSLHKASAKIDFAISEYDDI
jgi:uncharacterized protein